MAHRRPLRSLAPLLCIGALAASPATAAGAAGLPTPQPARTASACPGATLTPAPGNLEEVRSAVLCLIDRERAAAGESPLRPDAKLQRAAQGHSEEMVAQDYFAHVAPDGSTPTDRMRAAGYIPNSRVGYEVGENIAWGTLWLATPQAIVNAWMASPGHRANILDAGYRDTGIGVAPHAPTSLAEGQAGAIYTQDFGTIVAANGHESRSSSTPASRSHGGAAGAAHRSHARPHGASHRPTSSSHRSHTHPGRITSGTRTSERSRNGSSGRQVRHRHRKRPRHRPRHRRNARRRRRAGAHQRSRRRHRRAGRPRDHR
ncbi:MAG TPA: CAP domain-containing protein [Solirubrobacteraceae bacterium]|nr:CAP domain-containing protein [Solirubrobacteraceae bacterium]